MGMIMI